MKYSRSYLEKLKLGSKDHQDVLLDLFTRASRDKPMSYSESEYLFRFTIIEHTDEHGNKRNLDPRDFKCCGVPFFNHQYLIYLRNFNGAKPALNHRGLIPIPQKMRDLKELDFIHQEWLPNLGKFNHKDQLLNLIASEANKEIKTLKKLRTTNSWGYNSYKAKEKGISLHSKYLYNKITMMFEESPTKVLKVDCGGIEVIIDQNSIVHICWRHYAGIAKQFPTNKSFHLDRKLSILELPFELQSTLDEIGNNIKLSIKSSILLPIKLRGVIYSIWLKKVKESIKGLGQTEFIRLSTFYPTEEQNELNRILDFFVEIKVNKELSVFELGKP